MMDIAKELHVVQGLCYRYFPSKRQLFEEAMQQYVQECCADFVKVIHDPTRTIFERMDAIEALMAKESGYRYHDFYHKSGNEEFHEVLSMKMCSYMLAHVAEELSLLSRDGLASVEQPKLAAGFLLYGQMGLLQEETLSAEKLAYIRTCIEKFLGIRH